jgi:hypothetical protein
MGFFDAFKKKKTTNESSNESKPQASQSTTSQSGKRIKKYTSEGKPVYE